MTDPMLQTVGLDRTLGVDLADAGPDRVVATLDITDAHKQPHGIVHGGVYCAMVETCASVGASLWFGERGRVVGVSNHTDFLRAAADGRVTATATPIHRGRSQQLWLVEITDAASRLVARGQVRLQNLTPTDS